MRFRRRGHLAHNHSGERLSGRCRRVEELWSLLWLLAVLGASIVMVVIGGLIVLAMQGGVAFRTSRGGSAR